MEKNNISNKLSHLKKLDTSYLVSKDGVRKPVMNLYELIKNESISCQLLHWIDSDSLYLNIHVNGKSMNINPFEANNLIIKNVDYINN